MSSFKDKLSKLSHHFSWSTVAVLAVAVFFCLATSYYNYQQLSAGQIKWNSPDETANYFFAKNFSASGELSVFEPLNLRAYDLVHPRSFRSDLAWLKPVSFLGIILIFGKLGAWLGDWIIPFLTPIFAAFGIFFFYLLIKRLFSERVGLIASILLASFPVYIYYSVRSLFHNVLFIVFVIIAFYFLSFFLEKKYCYQKRSFWRFSLSKNISLGWLWSFLSGLFFGLAVLTRASELLWLGPLLFLIWLFNIRRAGILKPLIFLTGAILALLPGFYYNQILYGSPIYGGYGAMNQSLADISRAGQSLVTKSLSAGAGVFNSFFNSLSHNIFYFGFNLRLSLKMFYYYFALMFPWLLLLGFWGAMFLLGDSLLRFKRRYLVYILGLILTTTILVFYYGSWQFNDNPDPKSFTIGNSYTRYWLPIYLFFLPLASLFIVRISQLVLEAGKSERYHLHRLPIFWSNALQACGVLVIMVSSLLFVSFGSEEGLFYLADSNYSDKVSGAKVIELTEPSAVIITQYHDKFLFPERRVLVGLLNDDNMNYYYSQLAQKVPVYYYNFSFPQKDIDYLNNSKLAKFNLNISLVKKIDQTFSLYKLNYFASSSTPPIQP